MKKPILILSILSVMLFSSQPVLGQKKDRITNAEAYAGPIIDMHMHTGLPHEIPAGTPSLCRPEPCQGNVPATVDSKELLRKSLAAMDEHNIRMAFLSGVDWGTVKEWKNAAPTRFIASPFIIIPGDVDLEELKQEYEQGNFAGMGEIGTQLAGLPPNDPALEPYFILAEEQDVPVLIHTMGIGPYMPQFRTASGNPLLLEEVLVKHPKLRLFVENAGYPYKEEMISMMYQYPQLYADVSTITWVIPRTAFYDYLEAFVRAGLEKRIMFGSDQMVWPEKITAAVEAIDQAPFLNREQKQDIFHDNAMRFLRLEDIKEETANNIRKH